MADYVIRVARRMRDIDPGLWDPLVQRSSVPTPFMRHAYLLAMEESGSATADTGWDGHYVTLHAGDEMVAACPLYFKTHSYGEYVFDWAWARAYAQHQLPYYPKAVIAVPFTPVPGDRLLASSADAREALIKAVVDLCQSHGLSSLHILFASDDDVVACQSQGLMTRKTVQFHWQNTAPGHANFEGFLATLQQEKRKKIRQERRKVHEAGVQFRCLTGNEMQATDWEFFYQCYERTYLEHGNPPYLNRDFFHRMAQTMPDNWVMCVGERNGQPIACSLLGLERDASIDAPRVAYGRYWGATERVDCLHFEACYYQPIEWCIRNGIHRFEGGAQGEHKMSRALLPTSTTSAHWIAHPAFSDAIADFLQRESSGLDDYMAELQMRSPLKRGAPAP